MHSIVWTHKHGTEVINVRCPQIVNEKMAWCVLHAAGCDVEPELSETEFIEDYSLLLPENVDEVDMVKIDESFETLKEILIERGEVQGGSFGDSKPSEDVLETLGG